jgi:hypothetical protein
MRLAKLSFGPRSAIPAEARNAGSRHRRDNSGFCLDLADDVAIAFGDVQITRAVEPDLVRHVQRSLRRGSAVPRITALAVSGDRRHAPAGKVQSPNALIIEIAKIKRAVGTHDEPVRVIDLRVGIARNSVAGDGGNCCCVSSDLSGAEGNPRP